MATMPERMATQETLMKQVRQDVSEIKRDVKTLIAVSIIAKAIPWGAIVALTVALFIK